MKLEELSKHNGQNGEKAYVAYKGKVYDVTNSKRWQNGVHMARHRAGEDLTDFLALAPHTDEVLKSFEVVDTLEIDESKTQSSKETLIKFYQKFHPHPVLIHYPLGLFFFAALMQLLFLLTSLSSFELSAIYAFFVATIMAIPAISAGFLSWWINYDKQTTKIFKNKITFSIILVLIGITGIVIRVTNPDISSTNSLAFIIYNVLIFANLPIVLFIAYEGGKITWA
ncbi:MAG: cytochrome b5 domain-containing protein [Desulfurella sp.]|nr:cytochrome B5 [Desulfurella acetivorans A63]